MIDVDLSIFIESDIEVIRAEDDFFVLWTTGDVYKQKLGFDLERRFIAFVTANAILKELRTDIAFKTDTFAALFQGCMICDWCAGVAFFFILFHEGIEGFGRNFAFDDERNGIGNALDLNYHEKSLPGQMPKYTPYKGGKNIGEMRPRVNDFMPSFHFIVFQGGGKRGVGSGKRKAGRDAPELGKPAASAVILRLYQRRRLW